MSYPKNTLWNVYLVMAFDDGCGNISESKRFIRQTRAVSSARAESNVRHDYGNRYGIEAYDTGHDSSITSYFEAELAN